jgi:hypothetical protein
MRGLDDERGPEKSLTEPIAACRVICSPRPSRLALPYSRADTPSKRPPKQSFERRKQNMVSSSADGGRTGTWVAPIRPVFLASNLVACERYAKGTQLLIGTVDAVCTSRVWGSGQG